MSLSMHDVVIKRIYEAPARGDGCRVLVDRVWPRGVTKEEAALDHWAKDLAPSTELRHWFNHDVERWAEFQKRYRAELAHKKEELNALLELCKKRRITLLFGAKDETHNQAVVLRDVLRAK